MHTYSTYSTNFPFFLLWVTRVWVTRVRLYFVDLVYVSGDSPLSHSGGAGKLEHFLEAARDGGADILLAASVFHFGEITIRDLKAYLAANGIPVTV